MLTFDSCNSCKRLHESQFPFFSRIEFVRSKLSNLSAHVAGVNVSMGLQIVENGCGNTRTSSAQNATKKRRTSITSSAPILLVSPCDSPVFDRDDRTVPEVLSDLQQLSPDRLRRLGRLTETLLVEYLQSYSRNNNFVIIDSVLNIVLSSSTSLFNALTFIQCVSSTYWKWNTVTLRKLTRDSCIVGMSARANNLYCCRRQAPVPSTINSIPI